MVPILYQGILDDIIGPLKDAISCSVVEERNGSFELVMEYPVGGIHYDEMQYSDIISAVPGDGADEAHFRIYQISTPMNGIVTINAEHVTYSMRYTPVLPITKANRHILGSLSAVLSHATRNLGFTLRTNIELEATYGFDVPRSMRDALLNAEGSMLDVYGGEWSWSSTGGMLLRERGVERGMDSAVMYGKNLTDIQQEVNIANTYTGVLPYYSSNDVTVVGDVQEDIHIAAMWPYSRIKLLDVSGDFSTDPPTKEQVNARGLAYANANITGKPRVSMNVKFVPLWKALEHRSLPQTVVKLCDTVPVVFERLGISTTAKVVKTDYNVLLERYNSVELGEPKKGLGRTISQLAKGTGVSLFT